MMRKRKLRHVAVARKVTLQSIIASNWSPHLKSLIELAQSLCHSWATCSYDLHYITCLSSSPKWPVICVEWDVKPYTLTHHLRVPFRSQWSIGLQNIQSIVHRRSLSLLGHVARISDNIPAIAVLCVASNVRDGIPSQACCWHRPRGRQSPSHHMAAPDPFRLWPVRWRRPQLCPG